MSLWRFVLVFIMGFSLTDQEPIRLVNGPSRCAGRVEIFYRNRWGPVCDDSWDTRRGEVVCRQLDCGVVLSAPGNAAFGFETDQFWLDDVNCNGTESKLSDCQTRPWGQHNCRIREAASAVCSGDLAKPNISLSSLSSGGLSLTCTVPPLHQSTAVNFYQVDAPTPIKTMPLDITERAAMHNIGPEAAIKGAYLCQYEVKAARTSQVFLSPRSDARTVEQGNSSTQSPPPSTTDRTLLEIQNQTEGSSQHVSIANTNESHWEQVLPTPTPAGFVQEGPGTRVTVLAASIVVAVVVLAAVVAGLVFAYNKKWYSGCAAKKADTAAEKISDGKFMGSNQAKVGGPISCLNSPFAIHHSENSYVIQGDGSPGMPHIYEKVTLPCQHVGPVNGANEQRQEKSGIYEMMVQNNHSSNPSSRNNEDSTYQALTLDTLTENTYDTLSQIKLKM
ncbi:hypothetical protein NDU88_009436 [Pleurodeles waltl]|uniref:SRCR domain-containing protein n=1 Tax=Pleurodeles waltl TaxID=8319 RepID=A0AAV7PS78_PLEWA|nr:hypothetical protein NDU88_009436 [Pleurodeles waltl]